MSEMAKKARKALRDKASRLVQMADPHQKVDGSSYTPPGAIKRVQTGMRPISDRQYRRGGVVEGESSKPRADRKKRSRKRRQPPRDAYKNGGGVPLTADSLVNKDMKEANELRKGEKHIGGLKKGGRAERAKGGSTYASADDPPKLRLVKTHADDEGRKAKVYKDTDWDEYRVKFLGSDGKHLTKADYHTDDLQDAHSTAKAELGRKGWKAGGRAKRAAGGAGAMGSMAIPPMSLMMAQNHPARRAKDEREQRVMRAGRKAGGRTGKAGGGVMEALSPAYALFKNRDKDAVKALSPIANLKKGGHVDAKMDASMIKKAVHKHEGRLHAGKMKTKLASGGYAGGGMPEDDIERSEVRGAGGPKNTLGAIFNKADEMRGARAGYSPVAVDKAIGSSNRSGRKIGKREASKIHRLLKGRASGGKALDGTMQGTRPTGGRLARKDGGTVTNIYFDSKKGGGEGPPGGLMPPMMPPPMPPMPPPGMPPGGPPMPPPHMGPPPGGPPMGPPPGGPPGMPPGMPPMMRRAGGRVGNRTYRKPQDMDAGAGSGLGRLEKIQIQKGK